MSEILGYLMLAILVPVYLRWEWRQSEADRKRRREMANEIHGLRRVK